MNEEALIQFLVPWYGVEKHHLAILAYLQSIIPSNNNTISWIKRKTALKAVRASKKVKFLDDPVAAEIVRITVLRDQWLVQRGKANAETKTRIIKAANAEKKEKDKADKARKKNPQQQDIRQLAITNHRKADVGSFWGVLSDPHTEASSDPPEASIIQTPVMESGQATARSAHQASKAKKKNNARMLGQQLLNRKNRTHPPTSPPQMELIWPGKRKVRVTTNAVQNIPSKRIRKLNDEWCCWLDISFSISFHSFKTATKTSAPKAQLLSALRDKLKSACFQSILPKHQFSQLYEFFLLLLSAINKILPNFEIILKK